MRKLALILLMLACAYSCFAARGNSASYKSGNETVQGMLYTPTGQGPFPAIIVIHEWWGLNDWVKEQASKLSDQGYVALAVDLYRGKVASTPDEAHELMRGVPQDRAIPVEDVKKFEQTMKQLGKQIEIMVYPDAGHAFENPNNKDGYRPEDAADAWKRTVSFLERTLKQ